MAEENERTDDQPGEPATGDPPSGTDGADASAEVEKWKALARKHERQAKENADAAKRLAEIEDSKKSELEKLSEAQAAAEKRAAEAELKAMRLEVAAAKGLTPAQARRLVGGTQEELEADADELLATFAPPEGAPDTGGDLPRRPRESLRPGATATPEPEKSTSEIVAAIPRT